MIYLEHLCAASDTTDQSLKKKKKMYYKINLSFVSDKSYAKTWGKTVKTTFMITDTVHRMCVSIYTYYIYYVYVYTYYCIDIIIYYKLFKNLSFSPRIY